jgi:2,5-diketo-D-gluconate reductase A
MARGQVVAAGLAAAGAAAVVIYYARRLRRSLPLTLTLRDGRTMPAIGFGTFQIPASETENVVATALAVGYRHIDTAEFYANEKEVGMAIAASGVSRGDIFITTKLDPGNAAWGQTVKTYEATIAACETSVRNLGSGAIDLYLIHTPLSGKQARLDQWRALVECQRRGLCVSVGVSNFETHHLEEMEAAGLPTPAANQIELHPLCQKASLLSFMAERSILPIAYSSLAPLSSWRDGYTALGGSKSGEATATPLTIPAMATRLGVSEARLLLRYALQRGWAVLPKSVKEERMRDNFDLRSFEIGAADMATLDALENGMAFAFGAPGAAFDPSKVA